MCVCVVYKIMGTHCIFSLLIKGIQSSFAGGFNFVGSSSSPGFWVSKPDFLFVFWSRLHIVICNRVYCIHVPGHDPLTFSFRSFSFLIGWGFYGPII